MLNLAVTLSIFMTITPLRIHDKARSPEFHDSLGNDNTRLNNYMSEVHINYI